MSFASDIRQFSRKTGVNAEQVFRKLGFQAFNGVLIRSPVDEGRFRASNRISINSVDSSVEPEDFSSDIQEGAPATGAEVGKADAAIGSAKIGDRIYITNNLPYAQALEDGHSQRQAPRGVYSLTFQELKSSFRKEVRKVSR